MTRRFAVSCGACGARWMEDVEGRRLPGERHRCAKYRGPEEWRRPSTIRHRIVRHIPGREHPCTLACWAALGPACQCVCQGRNHGKLQLSPRKAISKAEIDALYGALEAQA